MSEAFELPVVYQGNEILFPAELFATGFSYKIKVMVDGIGVFFEPDEEKNYRATIDHADQDKANLLDKSLLQAISETLHELF